MMSEEIRPCPFCGAKGIILEHEFGDKPPPCYRVQCVGWNSHALDHWDDTEQEAIKTWNQRA